MLLTTPVHMDIILKRHRMDLNLEPQIHSTFCSHSRYLILLVMALVVLMKRWRFITNEDWLIYLINTRGYLIY